MTTRSKRALGSAAIGSSLLALVGGSFAVAPGAVAAPACSTAPAYSAGTPSFDGDNEPDVAYGEPMRRTSGNAQAGAVRVAQSCAPDVTLTAASVGLTSNSGAQFGKTVTASKIDADSFADLVISAPGQNGTGVVVVVFGSANGINQGRAALSVTDPRVRAGDRFGESVVVTTTRFNAGGLVDPRRHIVVGAPGTDVGSAKDAGTVYDFSAALGTAGPASFDGGVAWVQGSSGFPGSAETGDRFGEALSAGSVDWPGVTRDARSIAIGVPHEDVGQAKDAGAVYVVSGTNLNRVGSVSRATTGVPGTVHAGDLFGHAVLGRGNSFAVGAPGDDVGKARDAGSVQRIKVMPTTYALRVSDRRTQSSQGVGGTAESGDHLGSSLASVGDDQAPYIAAGAPDEDVSGHKDAGAVTYLSFDGACDGTCPTVTQNSSTIAGKAETGDHFGATVTTVYGVPGETEFSITALIGVPDEDVAGRKDAGALAGSIAVSPIISGPSAGEHLGEVAPTLYLS